MHTLRYKAISHFQNPQIKSEKNPVTKSKSLRNQQREKLLAIKHTINWLKHANYLKMFVTSNKNILTNQILCLHDR